MVCPIARSTMRWQAVWRRLRVHRRSTDMWWRFAPWRRIHVPIAQPFGEKSKVDLHIAQWMHMRIRDMPRLGDMPIGRLRLWRRRHRHTNRMELPRSTMDLHAQPRMPSRKCILPTRRLVRWHIVHLRRHENATKRPMQRRSMDLQRSKLMYLQSSRHRTRR